MSIPLCKDCRHKRVSSIIGRLLGLSDEFCDRKNREPNLVTGIVQATDYASSEQAGNASKYCGKDGQFFSPIFP